MSSFLILSLVSFIPRDPAAAADLDREKIVKTVKTLLAADDPASAITYVRERLAESSDPSLRVLLAGVLSQGGQQDEALSILESLELELERKETKLTPEEQSLQKAALDLRETILPGSREFLELKKSSVAKVLEFAKKKIARGDGRTGRLAAQLAGRIDPGNNEAEKVKDMVEEMGVRGDWKDLTLLKPASVKEPKGYSVRFNSPPSFTGESLATLRKAGFYTLNQKFMYIHPPDDDEGSWAVFRFPSPVQVFKAKLAIPHPEKKEGDVIFKVFADGKEALSQRVRAGDPPVRIFKRIPACRELKLFVDRNGQWYWDDCLWIDPMAK